MITFTVAIIYVEIQKWFTQKKMKNFATMKQLPVIGIAGRFIGVSNEEIVETVCEALKEVEKTPVQVWLGPILAVAVCEPQDIQVILMEEHCLNKPHFYQQLNCDTSIIATNREIWRPHRRALNTAFNPKMLQSYMPLLNEKTRILMKVIEKHGTGDIDLYHILFICLIDMITRTTMGVEMNLQSERGRFLSNVAKTIMSSIQYRITRLWLVSDFVYSFTKVFREEKAALEHGAAFMEEIYQTRLNELKHLRDKGIDYLEIAKEKNSTNLLEKCITLERDGIFTHENVIDQLRVILLAGIDTSSITIFSTLLMLAIHPKHQDLVVAELRSIFDDADCEVMPHHLANMNYLERVIKESLRLFPPAPFIGRKCSADVELAAGTIPKNTFVLVNIMQLHHNQRIWGANAEEFEPDRFLPENVAKRPPFSYIPFSGGSRNW